ncbi:hypothetical protein [Halomarina ordinaria]|uniref:Uncharacterized protein n=1 Tax=Halomarina ordinaria TaxID=3033939 RepID=A0ABD5UA10_9EURY|nr:hypothetical protein [Halomarina sp. PSRA2]
MARYERVALEAPQGRWTETRLHTAGSAGLVGGVLYGFSTLLPETPVRTVAAALGGLFGLLAVVLLLLGIAGYHLRYGHRYGRPGTAFAALTGLAVVGIGVGLVLNTTTTIPDPLAPEEATLGGTVWFLSMLLGYLFATGYGVTLLRAGTPSRLGGVLLVSSIPLAVVVALALDAAGSTVELVFTLPFGLAWAVLGYALWRDDATIAEPVEV